MDSVSRATGNERPKQDLHSATSSNADLERKIPRRPTKSMSLKGGDPVWHNSTNYPNIAEGACALSGFHASALKWSSHRQNLHEFTLGRLVPYFSMGRRRGPKICEAVLRTLEECCCGY